MSNGIKPLIGGNTAELRQDLASPSGTDLVGYSDDAPARILTNKLQDVPSVKDFGAKGDAVTDDTLAFLAAGPGAVVPAGEYVVDTSQVKVSQYTGPGIILYRGNRIALGSRIMDGIPTQRLAGTPRFGWTASGENAQLYSGAGNSTQGIAWLKVNGVEKLYITQRISGSGADERCRISEWNWTGDGSDMTVVAFTDLLNIGHGSALTAFIENGQVYLYTTGANVGTIDGGAGGSGKGYSKVRWRGAATTQADITNYRLFGDPTDTDGVTRLTWPQSASSCVTTDGRYVILVTTSYTGTGRFFFVYDRQQIEAVGSEDVRTVQPLIGPIAFERGPGQFGSTMQGICSDGVYVYTVWGLGAPRAARTIQVYDMFGRLQYALPFTGAALLYTEDELMGLGSRGIPVSFEPEGICLRGDELLTLSIDGWKTPQDIVTYEGRNWACLNTTATAGSEPSNRANWVETKLASTTSYDPAVEYIAGPYSFRQKRVLSIKLASGAPGEKPLQSGVTDATTGTIKEYYPGSDIAFNAENGSFTIAKFYEALGTYKKLMEFNYNNNVNFFSTEPGDLTTRWVTLKSAWGSAMYGMQLRSSGGTAAGGANIDMHAVDCPAAAGELTLSSTDVSAVRIRNGSTTCAVLNSTGIVYYGSGFIRSTTDGVVDLGRSINKFRDSYCTRYFIGTAGQTMSAGSTAPEGSVTAPPGSVYLRSTGELYIKTTGTGNTGWILK